MLNQLSRRQYVEGDNLKVEIYGTEDSASGLEALARRVVATKPDIIFVGGVGGPFVQRMTHTIPTVVLSSDLVGQGLVESMAHPGGNVTGVAADSGPLIWGKRIGLLREMVPSMTRLAFLGLSASSLVRPVQVPAVEAATAAQGVALTVVAVVSPAPESDYRAAIESARGQGADALLVGQNPQTALYAPLLAELTAAARLPAMYPFRDDVEAGGLIAYWEDFEDLSRRCGDIIAAILDGAKPADIPVEQPSRHFLTINLKAARALGIDVPPTLLASADEVIE
jgi:putative ABC transport system substrate-binding protein